MLELIYDRTSSDVQYAKNLVNQIKLKGFSNISEELKELYEKGLKGCYSTPDLNRVENAVQYISDLLNELSYRNEVNTKSWEFGELFTSEQIERYLQNIQNLRDAIKISDDVPQVPTSYKPYSNANDIEKILQNIYDLLVYLFCNFIHSGVSNSGQNRLRQQRFRKSKVWATQNYTFSQYLDTDTVLTISSRDTGIVESGTDNLDLAQLNEHQKVVNSIATLNNSINKIDDLVGYPVEFYKIRNIIPDPSFENNKWNDTNNNSAYSTTEKAFGNRSLYFAVGTTIVANIEIERPIVGHKYYGRRYIKTNGDNQPADCRFEVWGADGANMNWVYAWNNGNHPEWEFGSAIHEIAGVDYPETDRTIIRCFNVNTTADTWVDGLMLIDLTECFGTGNEPSLEWCDANIPYVEEKQMITVRKEDK